MFNTITNKSIGVLGFAFKKDTGDTRESAAITLCKFLMQEQAQIRIYDPKVKEAQIFFDLTEPGVVNNEAQGMFRRFLLVVASMALLTENQLVRKNVHVCSSVYEAATDADALVIVTEWDEFLETNIDCKSLRQIGMLHANKYLTQTILVDNRVYDSMHKPAFIFDGRLILNKSRLENIGFQVDSIGQP